MTVFVDADGCPVVDRALQFSSQANIECVLICDTSHVYEKEGVKTITVPKGKDAVDFVLVNLIKKGDIVITQDFGLAAMCLARGATVINQNGKMYTNHNIDDMLEARHTARKIRAAGGRMKGPAKRRQIQNKTFEENFSKLLKK